MSSKLNGATDYPTAWRSVRIADHVRINPESLGSETADEYQFRYIDISSVERGAVNWSEVETHTYQTAPSRAKRIVRPHDILLSTVRPSLQGHTYAEWNRGGDIVCSTGFAVLRAGQEVKPSFLRHLAFSDIVGEQLRERITGSNYPAVRSSDVEELEIPLPPLPEQRRIADVLDTVDAAIQETDAVIDKQEQVKTGLLQDLLTRGLDAEGRLRDPERNPEAFRETELGRLPKQWSVRRFEDLIDEGPQNGLYKPKSAYTDGEQGFPIVRIDSFYGGKLTAKDELRRLKLTESERRKYGLEPDDILVNRVNSTGFIGKNAIVPPLDEPTVFESNIMRIEVDESEILPKYLNGLMNTPIVLHQLQRRAKDAVAQSSINQQDVKGCLIPVPKLEEQGLVVDRIETEEGVIDKERAYKAKLQRLKTGLMQDLLTGRVRVPEAEARVDEVLA